MGPTGKFHYFVDTTEYATDAEFLTGADIKAKIAGFNPTYALYLENAGKKPDELVNDTDRIDMKPGDGHGVRKFYTVPPATFG